MNIVLSADETTFIRHKKKFFLKRYIKKAAAIDAVK